MALDLESALTLRAVGLRALNRRDETRVAVIRTGAAAVIILRKRRFIRRASVSILMRLVGFITTLPIRLLSRICFEVNSVPVQLIGRFGGGSDFEFEHLWSLGRILFDATS